METKMRGRPKLVMTQRRRQVLECLAERSVRGERITLAEVARRCGLFSYNDARRIVKDLKTMGAIKYIGHSRNEIA